MNKFAGKYHENIHAINTRFHKRTAPAQQLIAEARSVIDGETAMVHGTRQITTAMANEALAVAKEELRVLMAVHWTEVVPGQAGRPNCGGLVLGCIDADVCKETVLYLIQAQVQHYFSFLMLSLFTTSG